MKPLLTLGLLGGAALLTSCSGGTPDMHALAQFAGPWSLEITDASQNNNNGYFVAWSLDLQGVR